MLFLAAAPRPPPALNRVIVTPILWDCWCRKFSLTAPCLCVLVPFMSAALQLPTPTTEPDPPRAGADTPSRLGRVLSLVRKLIDYGRQLAVTVQQRAAAPGFALFASSFGTADLAVILARITNGLRRAAMLEAKLLKRAERGQDLTVAPTRLPAIRVPGAARPVAPLDAQPDTAAHRPPPRPPALGGENRRRGALSARRRRHRRYLLRSRYRARPSRPGILGRNQPRHHHVWRQPRPLLQRRRRAAVGRLPHALTDRTEPGWPAPPPRSPVPATGPP